MNFPGLDIGSQLVRLQGQLCIGVSFNLRAPLVWTRDQLGADVEPWEIHMLNLLNSTPRNAR